MAGDRPRLHDLVRDGVRPRQHRADLPLRLKWAGLAARPLHHFHRGASSLLIELKVHDKLRQEILGHVDARTTNGIYTHTDEDLGPLTLTGPVASVAVAFFAADHVAPGSQTDMRGRRPNFWQRRRQ